MREWLQFDYRAGWGTDAFETKAPANYKFPPRWKSIDDRYDARAILDDPVVLPSHPAAFNLRPTEREIMALPTKPFLPESKPALEKLRTGKVAANDAPEKVATTANLSKPESPIMRSCLTTAFLFVLFAVASLTPPALAAAAMAGETVICPTCGHEMPANFNFCSNCGTNLENIPRVGATAPAAPTTTSPALTARNNPGFTKPGAAPERIAPNPPTHKPGLFDLFRSGRGSPAQRESSALSDKPVPLQLQGFPDRPKPIIEIGQNPFLGRGPIGPGIKIPTGAVWQPVFLVYGTGRTALQTFGNGNGNGQITEWANRLDLYGNLYFTPTERLLIGFRPLDRNGLDYSGYRFDPPPQTLKNDLNACVTTLFFQGDFGELFPNLDPNDTKSLDYQFAIGRQPLSFEDGIMINEDVIDAIGITKTALFFGGASSLRTTGIFAWNELNRNDNQRDSSAKLFGLFNSADFAKDTIDLDFAFVTADDRSGGDGAYVGVGDTRRSGFLIPLRASTPPSRSTTRHLPSARACSSFSSSPSTSRRAKTSPT